MGGSVRDLLLGKAPKDFDVATSATPEEVQEVFPRCRLIGRRFRLAHVRKGGALNVIGMDSPRAEFTLQRLVNRQLTVRGSCASAGEYPDCLDLIATRKVDVTALISAVAPLAEGASWFKRLYEREPGLLKVVLEP